jgi:DNA gyrase subunit A
MAQDDTTNQITDLTDENHKNIEEILDPNILKVDITSEMQKAYLDYAMSVIVARALPDVRDGLKPVQRRIIHAMQDQGMVATGKFHKSVAVVGEVLKKYHPHGDTSVYDAMVRMAQDFTLRYPLVWPQGNFGSVDGDPPAAMRYTEAKLNKISEELYKDSENETVDFVLNDLQNLEPIYLPSLLPNLLLNGASGIAVGMATNIPPHNLTEVINGLIFMVDNAEKIGKESEKEDTVEIAPGYSISVAKTEFSSTATVEDLIKIIPGPDFPTGGTIYDQKELMQMYATGKGRVVTRAKMDVEEAKGGRTRIIVTEIPYQVNKATLISKIADLVKNKKIEGISDLRDESNRKGMRIVVELKRDAVVKKLQNRLYKYTSLQNTFNTNMVALIDNEPKLMSLTMVMEYFITHRQEIVVKRTIFFLKKVKAREHILLGLKIALDNLDEVIKLIRASKDVETAKSGLMTKFGLSEIQAQAILDMQLRRLAALERQKIEDELREIVNTISDYESLLASPQRIIDVIKEEFIGIKDKYGDARKTKVVKSKLGDLEESDLIVNERCLVTISKSGYIKRLREDTYKKQGRGGKGIKGQELKEEDTVDSIKICSTHDYAMFFTNKGRVYKLRVWDIPETSRIAKGTALVNFLSIAQDERVESMLIIDSATMEKEHGYVIFGTQKGVVKKTPMSEYNNIRSNGIAAIKLNSEDNLIWVNFANQDDDIILVTSNGMSIRFKEKDARPMGRVASGVRGINLTKKNDHVVGMVVVPQKSDKCTLLIVSDKGYGKKTSLGEYKVQNRGGAGILTYKVTDKTGSLISAKIVEDARDKDVLIATKSGKFIRLGIKEVPKLGRATQGVRLIKLSERDHVTSVALLEDEIEEIETIEPGK